VPVEIVLVNVDRSVLNRIDPTVFEPSSDAVRLPVCAGLDPVAAPLKVALSPTALGIVAVSYDVVAFHVTVPVVPW
jgi:hypothetical protein